MEKSILQGLERNTAYLKNTSGARRLLGIIAGTGSEAVFQQVSSWCVLLDLLFIKSTD